MGRHWFAVCSLAITMASARPAAPQEREGLQPPIRGQHKKVEEEEERERALDVAQQLRSKAGGLRDKADEMRQKGKDDEAGKLDDQAKGLEDQASNMEEAAEEIVHPLGGDGGHRQHSRPQRD